VGNAVEQHFVALHGLFEMGLKLSHFILDRCLYLIYDVH
jgi:hypothetical protein